MSLAETIRKNQLQKEQDYKSDLLGYALGSTGNFSYSDGKIGFTPGGTMPSKTEAWNNYIRMKGSVSAQDLTTFNEMYTEAQTIQTGNQLQEISKLGLQGAKPRQIRDMVRGNDQMYNNLLDLITQLEGSGNPEAFDTAQKLKGYVEAPPKGLFGDISDEGMGPGTTLGLGAAAGTGIAAASYGRGMDATELADWKKNVKAKHRGLRTTLKSDQSRLNSMVQKRADLRNKGQMGPAREANFNKEITKLQQKVNASNQALKSFDARATAPKTRFQKMGAMAGRYPVASGMLGYGALAMLPSAGEYLGGETGREVGRTASNLGLLALAGRTLMGVPAVGPWGLAAKGVGAALYGIPAAYDLYNQYYGE